MEPPWIKYPQIAWGSSGWRMGAGEDYWCDWCKWFSDLTTEQKSDVRKNWPEPDGWQGFFDFIEHQKIPDWMKERLNKARAERGLDELKFDE